VIEREKTALYHQPIPNYGHKKPKYNSVNLPFWLLSSEPMLLVFDKILEGLMWGLERDTALLFKQIKQKLWIKSLPAQSEFAKFLNAVNIPVAWEDTSMTGQWHLPCHQILYTVAFTTCHHAFGWAIENIICWHRSRCTPVPKTNQQRKGNLLWDVGLVPILGN